MRGVTINGTERFTAASTLLQAVREAGIELPALCDDPRLKPCGSCRLCMVEIAGHPHPLAACTTPLEPGMEIQTHTPSLEAYRRLLLAELAAHYPAEAATAWPDKPFHQWLARYHIHPRSQMPPDPALVDHSHPYIRVDMNRCIYCFRCVRICDEVQGQLVWNVLHRGEATRIVAQPGSNFAESACVSCGACVDTCPTGALEDTHVLTRPQPTQWTRTTCPYCGTGCEIFAGSAGESLVAVKPVMDAPVNKGHLCVKGRYAFDFVHASDRVTQPMIRRNGQWRPASWDEAIGYAAAGLKRIRDEYGPDSIGILGSARATNEENYLAQKFARVVIGTNNVDCCARVCHAPTANAMGAMLGTGAATNSFDDIEQARTILVWGANATANHPIAGARIRQAALRGATLVVADPRRTELASIAAVHLQLRPGTDVAVLNAMASVIIGEQLQDETFLQARVEGRQDFAEFVSAWTPERAEAVSGVPAALIRQAARLYATGKPSMSFHGLGLTEHVQGTEGVMCLVNLALLTGSIGKPGSGVNPLRGQNNVQGSAHMGCEPSRLTGYLPIADGRAAFERVWKSALPVNPGMNLMAMMDAAEAGRLHALWAIGYDVLLTNANASATHRALSNLELVIVQDMFLNETAHAYGTVFLPAASSFEKDGTFMNSERRVQRVRRAIPPVGASKPDWEILCQVAAAMGHEPQFAFSGAEQIWNEIRSVWSAGSGISYPRIARHGLQWPCPADDQPGAAILHQHSFPGGRLARLRGIEWTPPPESPTSDFPLLLVTGRTLMQFNAGTMSMRTPNTFWRPGDTLDISPADAQRLGLSDGALVRVASRHGSAHLPLRIDPNVDAGQVFATFHCSKTFLNAVTGPGRDNHTATPDYKVSAVQVAPAGIIVRTDSALS